MIQVGIIGSSLSGRRIWKRCAGWATSRWWRCATVRWRWRSEGAPLNVAHAYGSVERCWRIRATGGA